MDSNQTLNVEPVAQMTDKQERARKRADRLASVETTDHSGSVTTESFDIENALDSL